MDCNFIICGCILMMCFFLMLKFLCMIFVLSDKLEFKINIRKLINNVNVWYCICSYVIILINYICFLCVMILKEF